MEDLEAHYLKYEEQVPYQIKLYTQSDFESIPSSSTGLIGFIILSTLEYLKIFLLLFQLLSKTYFEFIHRSWLCFEKPP